MDQFDIGVGLEQIAPSALAGIGFARDEQHFQMVAHAVDHGYGLVVDQSQFAIHRLGVEFEHITAAMFEFHRDFDDLTGRRDDPRDDNAVAPHRYRHRL